MLLSTSLSVHVAKMKMIGPTDEEILIIFDEVSSDDDEKNEKLCQKDFFLENLHVGTCTVLMIEALFLGRFFACMYRGEYSKDMTV